MKDRKGFTLIELLLVVAILAFLIAIIVVAASEISKDSKKRSMYASLRTVKTAMETYYIQNNEFPEIGLGTWDVQLLTWSTTQPRAIDSIPVDIFQDGTPNVDYDLYEASNEKTTYVCWSYGPDGQTDTFAAENDNITNYGLGLDEDNIFVTNAKGKTYSK